MKSESFGSLERPSLEIRTEVTSFEGKEEENRKHGEKKRRVEKRREKKQKARKRRRDG